MTAFHSVLFECLQCVLVKRTIVQLLTCLLLTINEPKTSSSRRERVA